MAKACSFSTSQVTGTQNVAIYSFFLAKLANFSKSGRANVSYIELFNIALLSRTFKWSLHSHKIRAMLRQCRML